MGLDTTHGCWHGPYGAFMRWRSWVAGRIGLPLELMQNFCAGFEAAPVEQGDDKAYDLRRRRYAPIQWPSHEHEPLVLLLNHSDCDGSIRWQDAEAIVDRLDEIVKDAVKDGVTAGLGCGPERADYDGYIPAAERFAAGLREAAKLQQDVEFH